MKRDDYIKLLDEYYKSIGREKTPPYTTYTMTELKACIRLFQIKSSTIS